MAGWLALAGALVFLAPGRHGAGCRWAHRLGRYDRPVSCLWTCASGRGEFGLVLLLGGPLGEEFGWRGYALPVLQERYSWRVASLVLGMVWGAWHLPLFYRADTAQSHIPVGLFMASTVALSVLFAWLFNHTGGSVLPALVLHTAINAWAWVIPIMVMPDGSNLRPYGLAVGLLVLLAVLCLSQSSPPTDVSPPC